MRLPKENIVILGPPGSGKTTQAEMLAKRFGLKHISLGAEFRRAVSKGSPLGEKVRGYLERGELVPHQIVMELVEKVVPEEGFALEGFPRELPQAEEFGRRLNAVIYLSLPDELGIRRILRGKKVGGLGVERHRLDDNLPALHRRFRLYHQQTEPVLEYYRRRGILVPIDGTQTIEDISRQLADLVETLRNKRTRRKD